MKLLSLLCSLTLSLLLITVHPPVIAKDFLSSFGIDSRAKNQFLHVDEAFIVKSEQQGEQLLLTVEIADNYYLYRPSIQIKGHNLTFIEPTLPAGTPYEDDFFGKTEIFYHQLMIPITLLEAGADASIAIRYQGCTEGLCYPPTEKIIQISPVMATILNTPATADDAKSEPDAVSTLSEQDQLSALLGNQRLWLSIATFFALGLGLAFTPCVFPMYPILTGIIAGAGEKLSTQRAFILSFVYVQGMAITYTVLGLVVASAGIQFQAALQHPYILIFLSAIFVLLALSMFGFYNLQLPSGLQTKLTAAANQQQGGSIVGVGIMGMISGLVCSPCTTAPLSGALLYVAQSGDLWLGGMALYALSLGMGLPLLLLGTSGGKLLPKAGSWMNIIKQLFGFALLAVPILLLSRLWNEAISLLLWLSWIVALTAYLYHQNQGRQHSISRSLINVLLMLLLSGTIVVGNDLLFPTTTMPLASHNAHPDFIKINNITELNQQLKAARGKPVLLDLYADWCVACKEFERITFQDSAVRERFSQMVLLQADVTANNGADVALLNSLNVLGLPTLIFFDANGNEITGQRVTGFMEPAAFVQRLDRIL